MKSGIPAISILMPVRNEARYLSAALTSILRQSFTDWQLVAVDDGSSDATPEILARTALNDSRVIVIRREGGGLVAALNTGLEACTAPLMARMDGDDISHPNRLEHQFSFLNNNPDVGLIACSFQHFPLKIIKQGMRTYESWQNALTSHNLILRDLFVESPFVHPSIMARRSFITAAGGYRDMGWPEDYDLWLRLAHNNVRFARTTEPLFFWRDHPERATRVMNDYTATAFRACKCHHLLNGFLKNRNSVIVAGAGQEGRAWQRTLKGCGISVSSWIDVDSRKIGRELHGSPVKSIESLSNDPDSKILVAIGVHGARDQFRRVAASVGLNEISDFVCVA